MNQICFKRFEVKLASCYSTVIDAAGTAYSSQASLRDHPYLVD